MNRRIEQRHYTLGEWLSANEHLPDAPVLKLRKSAAERRHRIAWGVSPRKSWSNQVLKAPEGRHRMKSHGVSPLRGFPLDHRHDPWGLRPRLFDAVPPGLKDARLQDLHSGIAVQRCGTCYSNGAKY